MLPVHHQWRQYIHAQLGAVVPLPPLRPTEPGQAAWPPQAQHPVQLGPNEQTTARVRLGQCDMHGSLLCVALARSPQHVGFCGIAALILARTVCLVGPENHIKGVYFRQICYLLCDAFMAAQYCCSFSEN
jgi:hypothetical protein